MNDKGQFMVIQANRNLVALGERFDASLNEIELSFGSQKAS
jgi:hypothetical protein